MTYIKKIITFILIILTSNYVVFSETSTENVPSSLNNTTNIQKLYPSFADIVEPLIPAVVNIQTEYKRAKSKSFQSKNFQADPLFQDYLFDFLEQQFNIPLDSDNNLVNTASGSGFVVDETGYIVTNHHVIVHADEIRVKFLDQTELPAKLIGSDTKTDLALLKVESKKPLAFVKFGKSKDVRVGDWVIAIGNPFGLGGTVTTGIISSKERDIDIDTGNIIDNFLQTDASINKGNSGGPMFNLNGEVVGVNTAIISPSGASIGIGFSIPSDTAKNIINELKKEGTVNRGSLDVGIQDVTDEIAEALGLKNSESVLVVHVVPSGAGEKAGLKSGDVITSFGGNTVKNTRKLRILVAEAPLNKEIKIGVIRSGKPIELTCKILKTNSGAKYAEIEENIKTTGSVIEKNKIAFSNITPEIAEQYNVLPATKGIVITKVGKYKNYGLKVGDVITEINQQQINNVDQFNKIIEEAKSTNKKVIILLIKRRNTNFYVAFPLHNEEGKNK